MADIIEFSEQESVVVMTPKEAVEMIAYLSAQLAGVPAPNSQGGACPNIRAVNSQNQRYDLTFVVKT